MVFHIADYRLFAGNIAVPFLESSINRGLGIYGPRRFLGRSFLRGLFFYNLRGRFFRFRLCGRTGLGHRKSGGLSALRFVNGFDLFLLRKEQGQGQLNISSVWIISSAWALQLFIRPTHFIGSLAFRLSVTPAAFISSGIICSKRRFAVSSIS